MSYMVHDEAGNVWPPQFKSELCDPKSPHCVLNRASKQMEAALAKAHAARASGKGWGNGEIAHLQRPLIPKGTEVAPAAKALASNAVYQYKWLCGGCGLSRTTTAGSKKIGGAKVCADCVAARAGKAAA